MATRFEQILNIAPTGDPGYLYTNGIIQASFVEILLTFPTYADWDSNYVLNTITINSGTPIAWSAISASASNLLATNIYGYTAAQMNTRLNAFTGLSWPLTPYNDYRDVRIYKKDGGSTHGVSFFVPSFQKNITSTVTYAGASSVTLDWTSVTGAVGVTVTPYTCPNHVAAGGSGTGGNAFVGVAVIVA